MKYLIILLLFISTCVSGQVIKPYVIAEDVVMKAAVNELTFADYKEVEKLKEQIELQRSLIEELKSEVKELSVLLLDMINRPK